MFETVVVIGLGLIGGSLSLDLKKCKLANQVIGYDLIPSHCQDAVSLGLVDKAFSQWNTEISQADLVVLAVPVGAFSSLIKDLHPWLGMKNIVTDVGSVKKPVMDLMETDPYQDICFVGGHPISGGETFGPGSARIGLFKNKKLILTPSDKTNSEALQKIKTLWTELGSNVYEMKADTHDFVFASVSHLPHLLAYATVEALGREDSPEILSYFGAGLKDFSRIAASSPEMWADIFLENQSYLLKTLDNFRLTIDELEQAIRDENKPKLKEHLAKSKKLRDEWITKSS